MSLPDWQDANLQAVSPIIDEWAAYYGLPRSVAYGLVSQESRFNPNAVGDAGRAHGLTQIWLPTAQGIGYTGDASGLQEPNTNVQFGLLYLKQMLDRFGSMDNALSAYNGGFKGGIITNPSYVAGVMQRAAYFDALWNGTVATDNTGDDASGSDSDTNSSGVVAGLALLVGLYGVLKFTRVL